MIIREKYLSKIRPFYDVDLIKVITGIRRSGKSVILKQIINELKEKGIKEDHIIYVNIDILLILKEKIFRKLCCKLYTYTNVSFCTYINLIISIIT